MNNFSELTQDEAILLITQHLGLKNPTSSIEATEISDGNLNIVYRVQDRSTCNSFIVKQAPPYIRVIGKSWPLTQQRIVMEVNTLKYFKKFSPNNIVTVLSFDALRFTMVMEDLTNCITWRQALIDQYFSCEIAKKIGQCMADIYYYSSNFYLSHQDKLQLELKFYSEEMCATTVKVFFIDPYQDCELNNINPELFNEVNIMRNNYILLNKVKLLNKTFNSKRQALLHGDFHTGSVMISNNTCKLIDAEFGFFGPIGFDIGTLIGNLLLNYCSYAKDDIYLAKKRLIDIENLWKYFVNGFNENAINKVDVDLFLNDIWKDTLGFAGAEMIRRIIGIAHVDDINSIVIEKDLLYAQNLALKIGQSLILDACRVTNIEMLLFNITSLTKR
ncbi:S-methyl-5-thioribose kinase [Photobacterium carnosum]|uniref:S-methyl-5-thioribose kinase n=1 Tax=Photobacterium carnosum TaxID=2023717 RepID=UPI001E51C777|nr:S-methyl-5-thioribose kinase [Photobacterium carnosum]MCD9496774.1 S-methyl-5-thioribose kinase [Photobacterium carnosum]